MRRPAAWEGPRFCSLGAEAVRYLSPEFGATAIETAPPALAAVSAALAHRMKRSARPGRPLSTSSRGPEISASLEALLSDMRAA